MFNDSVYLELEADSVEKVGLKEKTELTKIHMQ